MIINEIDVEKFAARTKKAQQKSAKLSGGFTGKGGQIGDVIKMAEKHHAFWKHAVQKNSDVAKSNPQGLLNAWLEKFYGTSSAKMTVKKATTSDNIKFKQGMKGAEAIFRIVTAILLKPDTENQAKLFREQIVDYMPPEMRKNIGFPQVRLPEPAGSENPTAAPNQTPKSKTYNAGDIVTWTSAKGNTVQGVVTGKEVKQGYTQVKTSNNTVVAVDFNKIPSTRREGK